MRSNKAIVQVPTATTSKSSQERTRATAKRLRYSERFNLDEIFPAKA